MLYPSYRPSAAQTANSTRYLQVLPFAGGTTIDEEGHERTFFGGCHALSLLRLLRKPQPATCETNVNELAKIVGIEPTNEADLAPAKGELDAARFLLLWKLGRVQRLAENVSPTERQCANSPMAAVPSLPARSGLDQTIPCPPERNHVARYFARAPFVDRERIAPG
jgi:hypothetical protein